MSTPQSHHPYLLGGRNGQHRRPDPTPHGGATHGAGDGTGAATIRATVRAKPTPAIPHAGIRAGEIIGWRLWLVERCSWLSEPLRLKSLVAECLWEPGQPMVGDVDAAVMAAPKNPQMPPIMGGVYAFAHEHQVQAEAYLRNVRATDIAAAVNVGMLPVACIATARQKYALGRVKLWGEVVEHEHGYRAQFAKVHAIHQVMFGDGSDLAALQHTYGVGGAD